MSLSFIFAMGWKSAIIAGIALLAVRLLRSRAASDRAAVVRLAVALLLAMPVVALTLPALQVETAVVGQESVPLPAAQMPALPENYTLDAPTSPTVQIVESGASLIDTKLLLLLAYATGLLLVGLRLGIGLATLRRWTAAAHEVTAPEWRRALARYAPDTAPRLLVSEELPSPISWGWMRPVILLDEESLDRPEDADAIIAHEMAHVSRRDWTMLLLARTAVALFWFNPLVWLLEREVAQQAEEAADSHALGEVEPARYAQTLVSCARSLARLPANSMAPSGGGLAKRVRAVLDGSGRAAPAGSRWTMLAMIGCIGLAAPVAALELIPASPDAAHAPLAPEAPAVPDPVTAASAPQAHTVVTQAVMTNDAPLPKLAAMLHDVPVPPAPPAPVYTPHIPHVPHIAPVPPVPPVPPHGRNRWIDEGAIEAMVEAQVAAAEAQVEAAQEQIERSTKIAKRAEAEARRASAAGMRAGAVGMEKGAQQMEVGARQMEEEARKLRDASYREHQIATARARGETVTHEQLIDAIPELRDGAREMRDGAKEMREGAREMRRNG